MTMYLSKDDSLQGISNRNVTLTCPKCLAFASASLVSLPRFELLERYKPKEVGLVYRCDSCSNPIFLRFPVRMYGNDRIELARSFEQVEKPAEKFDFTYLSEEVERDFREALIAYAQSAYNAFASMCRRTAQTMFRELGESGKMRVFDQLTEVRDLADIDEDTFRMVEKVMFDNDTERPPNIPDIDGETAGIMLEVMKDILYECYVRRGKLQEAMTLRRQRLDDGPGTLRPLRPRSA
ncbi:MAG: hypothetical protein HKN59_09945 [Gammaproteobacteria bacterium]|nr:hypothetical protein [Gammaproteobacteria bacterium]